MIDIRKLKELVRLMVNNDLTELDLRDSEEQVTLKRHRPGVVVPNTGDAAPVATAPAPTDGGGSTPATTASAEADDAAGMARVESPMVGTFYSAADPDSPAFVKVGDHVDPDTVVCLIEAMKIFNEIKAEQSGTIARVLVNNGEAVEFGQPMFVIRPD